MTKQQIRKRYLQLRQEISVADYQRFSAALVTAFCQLSLPGAQHVLSYSTLTARNEFDPSPCIHHLQLHFPQLKIAFPRILNDAGIMEAVLSSPETVYQPNTFGILEPSGGNVLPPNLIDLVFVPLVAVDQNGFRVGYGKGYYDRFLSACRKEVTRVGFSFFEPLPSIDDLGVHDVPLNFC
ncbi:MAG: 5-formyltetrahydrofolate cyclo-ligase, partial [Chitinophagaceae bacterium]